MTESIFNKSFSDGLRPDVTLPVDQWAEENVILSTSNANEPGRYRASRTPYMIQVMRDLSIQSPITKVVLMMGAQLSKTQVILNCLGSYIDKSPGPILFVEPTDAIAKKVSNQRLGQMIQDCKALNKKVNEEKTKDQTNTMMAKTFPGGVLFMTGANSAAALRAMPIRFLAMDEIDAYPADVEGEGSPISLAEKRTTTFSRRKIISTSTPTIKGYSAIESEFLKTDQRKFFVPCPHCKEKDVITWDRIHWENDDPTTAKLRCVHCNTLIDESAKSYMLANGEWRATATSTSTKLVGYHLSSLYSPLGWKSWKECVEEFIAAKNNPELLKVFVNTVLAETWEEKAEQLNSHELQSRLEPFPEHLPDGALVLICSCDVQDDRLEALIQAYGKNEESWVIAHTVIPGSPDKIDTWNEFTEFRRQPFYDKFGNKHFVQTTTIDSGGHFTEKVYKYAKTFENQGVFAIKGSSTTGKPIVSNPTKNNSFRCMLFSINTDIAKETIFARLKIKEVGGGFVHLFDWCDEEFLAQITAEKAIRKYVKGRGHVREWVKTRERNEALDLLVYNLAGLYLRGAKWVQKKLGSQKLMRMKNFEDQKHKVQDFSEENTEQPQAFVPQKQQKTVIVEEKQAYSSVEPAQPQVKKAPFEPPKASNPTVFDETTVQNDVKKALQPRQKHKKTTWATSF